MFVGGIAVSLAEILHTFPIIFRRFHLTEGLSWLMCAMAAGKICGALLSFYGGYWY
ncbi:MAG: stage V sporulation protein AB [Clostridiales bacterium]|nr:stage V sporulation protein AB [Clostridiales bacterium]